MTRIVSPTFASIATSCDRAVTRPVRIYGVAGHMHLRGVDIRLELDARTLLHIPREAVLGEVRTLYPEYRKEIRDRYVAPPPCTRNCGRVPTR